MIKDDNSQWSPRSQYQDFSNEESRFSFLRSWNINNPYNDAFILVSTFRRWYHAKYLHLSRTAFIVSTVESRGYNPGFRFCKPTALSINEVGSSLQLLPSRIRPNVTRILMHTNGYTHVSACWETNVNYFAVDSRKLARILLPILTRYCK